MDPRLVFVMSCALGLGFLVPAHSAPPTPIEADEQVLKDAGLKTDGPALLAFLRQRTGTEALLARVHELIKRLGDDDFSVREKASADLVTLGPLALPALREAKSNSDPEVVRRAVECLRRIESDAGPALVQAAARLVAIRKPAEASAVLLAYLPNADNENVADEVRAALSAVAVRDGRVEDIVVKALADAHPARRGAAAVTLCRTGLGPHQAAVRQLLQDRDAGVRLHVALALVDLKDRAAVPVLIDLLGELSPAQAWPVEDVLLCLADETAPAVPLGRDEASRRACREAWRDWWQNKAAKVDLARLDNRERLLGYTLIVVQSGNDKGRVLEVDAEGRVRWQIGGLSYPLDAQMVGNNRVLIAENGGGRVTERNLKGEILWEKAVNSPFAVQRLPGDHVFIATADGKCLEVDRAGKEVAAPVSPYPQGFMAVHRLRDGGIAGVTWTGIFVRLDPTGKERQKWPVGTVQTRGGLCFLPDGGCVVAHVHQNEVVEYNSNGKEVWKGMVQHPTSVVRLRNGNTLVAGWNTGLVIEMDRQGKTVWQHKISGEMA